MTSYCMQPPPDPPEGHCTQWLLGKWFHHDGGRRRSVAAQRAGDAPATSKRRRRNVMHQPDLQPDLTTG